MEHNDLNEVFNSLRNEFDVCETPQGHHSRFLKKLNSHNERKTTHQNWWKPLSIAASFATLIIIGTIFFSPNAAKADLASVSPEMEQTQNFFTTTIEKELRTLQDYESPASKALVDDTLLRISNLEKEYENLKLDLVESGNDKRVIYAMISNFQNRIALLQQVIETIEEVKTLNNKHNENTI